MRGALEMIDLYTFDSSY